MLSLEKDLGEIVIISHSFSGQAGPWWGDTNKAVMLTIATSFLRSSRSRRSLALLFLGELLSSFLSCEVATRWLSEPPDCGREGVPERHRPPAPGFHSGLASPCLTVFLVSLGISQNSPPRLVSSSLPHCVWFEVSLGLEVCLSLSSCL